MSRSLVRISFSVLLRVREGDQYVLFHSPTRPGVCGPPGGVVKYFPPACRVLDDLGFEEERMPPQVGAWDLRGLLPARSLRRFLSWFRSGAYREGSGDCLRRELVEEMDEVGLPPAGDGLGELEFTHVRTVSEGPDAVPGKHYRQLRRFEVFDLVTGAGGGLHLARRLLSAGVSAEHPDVVCASRADIRHGRVGRLLVAPQSAFLMGSSRLAPDLPPIR